MTVAAPPKPQPPTTQPEPEALIEEARRRTLRRRLKYAAAGMAALLIAGGIYAGLESTGSPGAGQAVPEGFHVVKGRGPVSHVLLRELRPYLQRLDLATGRKRPMILTTEVWWDPKSGFSRDVIRQDGRIAADLVSQRCQPGICIPPRPFDLEKYGFRWPLDPKRVQVLGPGRFRGRDVVWAGGLTFPQPNKLGVPNGRRVAFDARTHRLVAELDREHGHLFSGEAISVLPTLEAKQVAFEVPEGGAPLNYPSDSTRVVTHGLSAARRALGSTPLWLGRSFRGSAFRTAEVGISGMESKTGKTLRPAKYVSFNYGLFRIQEFGATRPYWYESGPDPGVALVRPGTGMSLSHGGLLVLVDSTNPDFRIDKATALTIVKALRPVPGR